MVDCMNAYDRQLAQLSEREESIQALSNAAKETVQDAILQRDKAQQEVCSHAAQTVNPRFTCPLNVASAVVSVCRWPLCVRNFRILKLRWKTCARKASVMRSQHSQRPSHLPGPQSTDLGTKWMPFATRIHSWSKFTNVSRARNRARATN